MFLFAEASHIPLGLDLRQVLWSAPFPQNQPFSQTERLLEGRKHAVNGNGDTSQTPDWTPASAISASAEVIRSESAVYSSRDGNPLERVTKLNRGLQARLKVGLLRNAQYSTVHGRETVVPYPHMVPGRDLSIGLSLRSSLPSRRSNPKHL